MNRSNLHPAVAAASPSHHGMGGGFTSSSASAGLFDASPSAQTKGYFGIIGGAPSPISPSYDAHQSMNEALARTRARELMQSYARDKQRASELEADMRQTAEENERLAAHVASLQKSQKECETQIAALNAAMTKERGEYELAFASMKEEMEKVTNVSAHQVSDLLAQLRLREEECAYLQGELTKAVSDSTKLRRDASNNQTFGDGPSDLQKAQARSVELARRLLESERAKRAAEDAVIDDRKHYHMALNTIEQLRQQLVNAEGRAETERGRREEEVKILRHQLDQARADFTQREEAYKRTLRENKSDDGERGSNYSSGNQKGTKSNSELATLCSTLEARAQSQQEHIDFLTEKHEKATERLQEAIAELQYERNKRVEEVTKAQETIRGLKDDSTRKELIASRKERERIGTALKSLTSLYEESIERFASLADSFTSRAGIGQSHSFGYGHVNANAVAGLNNDTFLVGTGPKAASSFYSARSTPAVAQPAAANDDIASPFITITRTLAEIKDSLWEILCACGVVEADELERRKKDTLASNGGLGNEQQLKQLMDMMMKQLSLNGVAVGGESNGVDGAGSGGVGRVISVSSGSVAAADELTLPSHPTMSMRQRHGTASAYSPPPSASQSTHPYKGDIHSNASADLQLVPMAEVEALQEALRECERSKREALEDRDAFAMRREREMREQIEQLVTHAQRLQRQSVMDEEEIESLRAQLETVEENASARIQSVRHDCAKSLETLYNVLKQIEAEHKAMIHRRATPARFGLDESEKSASPNNASRSGVSILPSTEASSKAEARLTEKIEAALKDQEVLLGQWQDADDGDEDE